SFLEKDGTFTNTDRRIKRVRPVIASPGDALPDGEIVLRMSRLLGLEAEYGSASDIMDEMAMVTPQYGGVTYERLDAEGELRWPCRDAGDPGTAILHAETFTRGLGAFAAVDHEPTADRPTAERPLVMTTGRHLWNFHTNTMTVHSEGLGGLSECGYLELSPVDAAALGIGDGDRVEVTSRHGSVETEARVPRRGGPKPGVVFMPFHFADSPANRITGTDLDPTAKIPELKVTSVRVRRVSGE
ncbi:MAG TPA: molybdopterin dinucleotide binding domain-containing protein, partial [Coriobacteriia bacterium]